MTPSRKPTDLDRAYSRWYRVRRLSGDSHREAVRGLEETARKVGIKGRVRVLGKRGRS